MAVAALVDPLSTAVAPHGIIGQGFDGLHIEGAKDNYTAGGSGIFMTSAQGEGAIEKTIASYVVDQEDPFSTAFEFGRFDAAEAPPRDVSKLA